MIVAVVDKNLNFKGLFWGKCVKNIPGEDKIYELPDGTFFILKNDCVPFSLFGLSFPVLMEEEFKPIELDENRVCYNEETFLKTLKELRTKKFPEMWIVDDIPHFHCSKHDIWHTETYCKKCREEKLMRIREILNPFRSIDLMRQAAIIRDRSIKCKSCNKFMNFGDIVSDDGVPVCHDCFCARNNIPRKVRK